MWSHVWRWRVWARLLISNFSTHLAANPNSKTAKVFSLCFWIIIEVLVSKWKLKAFAHFQLYRIWAHLPSAGPSSHSEQSYSIGGGAIGRPIRPIIRLRDRLLKPNVAAAPHRISIQVGIGWLVGRGGNMPEWKLSLPNLGSVLYLYWHLLFFTKEVDMIIWVSVLIWKDGVLIIQRWRDGERWCFNYSNCWKSFQISPLAPLQSIVNFWHQRFILLSDLINFLGR